MIDRFLVGLGRALVFFVLVGLAAVFLVLPVVAGLLVLVDWLVVDLSETAQYVIAAFLTGVLATVFVQQLRHENGW